jgi:hypothetical protein
VSIMLALAAARGAHEGGAAAAAGVLAELGGEEQDDARRQLQATILVAAVTLDPSLSRSREQVAAQLGAVDSEQGLGARIVQATLASRASPPAFGARSSSRQRACSNASSWRPASVLSTLAIAGDRHPGRAASASGHYPYMTT